MNRKISIVGVLVAGCLLLSSLSFAFMERHWNHVARRLCEGMARDMAAIVDLYETRSSNEDVARLTHIGLNRFGLSVAVLPVGTLPTPQPKPFFDLLDLALSDELRANVKHPFWVDTVGQSRQVEVRIKLDQAILRFVAPRGQAYASNSHIFLVWMVGTSAIVMALGYLVLRPVLRAT
jgi:two-component system osmolarity sensor histidine kinase EnvZ